MARGGLSLVRDALVTTTVYDVIDDDEFVLLIFSLREDECHTKLWFFKQDLDKLLECQGIPEKISCEQRTVCSGLDGILLKQLSYPCRYADMVPRFGRNPKELCLTFNAIVHLIYVNHNRRLSLFNQFRCTDVETVSQQGAPLSHCFGFIDGTVCGIVRPQENQRVLCNGQKGMHSLQFHSVVIPNGLIANIHGPFN